MAEPATVLIVEDEADQLRLIAGILDRAGYGVRTATDVESALVAVAESEPDVVLSDWKLPGRHGGDLLDDLRSRGATCAFMVMTAYGSIAHAVEAVRQGADDYLGKPFERDELLLAVRRVLRTRQLERENVALRAELGAEDRFGEIVGRSPAMLELYRTISKVGATDATVLVAGESGTGKELVARHLHRSGPRAGGRFVALNCAAIPEQLIESELFGHERGAFTGAERRREGRFAEAEGGTLFLDEISSMPPPLQARLLRVLQERRYTRVGGTGELATDVRVIAASNRDLAELVASGAMREDLYYRLNVVPIRVPPLRERLDDVPLLARTFLDASARRHGRQAPSLSAAVLRRLVEYRWPGNVRELANTMERLVLLTEGDEASVDDLPEEMWSVEGGGCPFRLPANGIVWDQVEEGLLRQAVERCGGNRAAAARLLGLSYKSLLYRLDKHGID